MVRTILTTTRFQTDETPSDDQSNWKLNDQSSCFFLNRPFEQRPVKTILARDSGFNSGLTSDDHFESHLCVNGL